MNANHQRQEAELTSRHLAHKKSLLTELKDQLLTGEISYAVYKPKADAVVREIRTLEVRQKMEVELR